jgi:hypothetical protein
MTGEVMKRLILFLCLLIIPCFGIFSSTMTDFSGTWRRDTGTSDAMSTRMDGKIIPISADLIIKQTGGRLDVESRWTHKAPTAKSYILDGMENTSLDDQGNATTYVTSWDGDKLILDEKIMATTPFGRAEIIRRSEWSLSDGGSTLTVLEMTGNRFGSARRQIYHR